MRKFLAALLLLVSVVAAGFPAGSPSSTDSILASMDTYIYMHFGMEVEELNFGDDPSMVVGQGTHGIRFRQNSYIWFEPPERDGYESATLALYAHESCLEDLDYEDLYFIYPVYGYWDEYTLTWVNRPWRLGSPAVSSPVGYFSGQDVLSGVGDEWVEFTVELTNQAIAHLFSQRYHGFIIVPCLVPVDVDRLYLGTRESGKAATLNLYGSSQVEACTWGELKVAFLND